MTKDQVRNEWRKIADTLDRLGLVILPPFVNLMRKGEMTPELFQQLSDTLNAAAIECWTNGPKRTKAATEAEYEG